MKPLNTLVINLTFCLSVGILLARYDIVPFESSCFMVLFMTFVLTIHFWWSYRHLNKTIAFGLNTYGLIICIGALTYNLHQDKNYASHYTHLYAENIDVPRQMVLRIKERLKPTAYHDKYIVELQRINGHSVSGKVLFNIKKDSLKQLYSIDDRLLISSGLRPIKKALNPNQFDYQSYMKDRQIFHQLTVQHYELLKINSQDRSLSSYAESFRAHINEKLKIHAFKNDELAVINALLLGQRQDMDRTLYDQYAKAGAVHILAVSGLHVGILLLLLNGLLKPLENFKKGRLLKMILIVVLLWCFAILAGLSASVTRAVTMFSIIAVAMHLKRQTNIYNTLALSAFILLLCRPMFLFDVGFQMSYLAVLAIVTLQPLLAKLWLPKWRILTYFWQLFTVTLAAQIGVFPISLYYFHQFPGLFFVTNLIIIPFLGFILGFGLLLIALALVNQLPEPMARLYRRIIQFMNDIISWVAQQDGFIASHISFEISHVLISYAFILVSIAYLKTAKFKLLISLLICIITIQINGIHSRYKHSGNKFVIFHKTRKTIIGYKQNSTLYAYHDLDSGSLLTNKTITSFCTGNFIDRASGNPLKPVYNFEKNIILVVDSLGVYNITHFQPNYVLLRNSPRINLERLIDSLHPDVIIADGSNYRSYVDRWQITCQKRKLPFHDTGKKGAFVLD